MHALPKELKGRKASEVFMEYANPYIEMYLEEKKKATLDEIEGVLKLPWIVWNAVVMQGNNQKIDFMASIRLAIRNLPAGAVMLIESMKERKLKKFAKYQYILGDFSLRFDEKSQETVLALQTRTAPKRK
jgi:hypothetical protein